MVGFLKENTYYRKSSINSKFNFDFSNIGEDDFLSHQYVHIKKVFLESSHIIADVLYIGAHSPHILDQPGMSDKVKIKSSVSYIMDLDESELMQEDIVNDAYTEVTKDEYENAARLIIMKSYEHIKLSLGSKEIKR